MKFICRNYINGVWHVHEVEATPDQIRRMIPVEDRAAEHLSIGETYQNPKIERYITRIL